MTEQKPSNEQIYYDALRRIAKDYRPAQSLIKRPDMGLEPIEMLEYSYDNIQITAANAIRGKRRPKQ